MRRIIDILRKAAAIGKRRRKKKRLAAEAAANQDNGSTEPHPGRNEVSLKLLIEDILALLALAYTRRFLESQGQLADSQALGTPHANQPSDKARNQNERCGNLQGLTALCRARSPKTTRHTTQRGTKPSTSNSAGWWIA